MRWLTNTRDPRLPDAKSRFIQEFSSCYEDIYHQWDIWIKYLEDKIIGDPKPTESSSVEYLKSIKYVGIYVKD